MSQLKATGLTPEQIRKVAAVFSWASAAIWTVLWIVAAIMGVTFGLWPVVVWPFTVYLWSGHMAKIYLAYKKVTETKVAVESPTLVVHVTEPAATPEQIAEAARQAFKDSTYPGWKASGYRTEQELRSDP
jgi:hypothetical protein